MKNIKVINGRVDCQKAAANIPATNCAECPCCEDVANRIVQCTADEETPIAEAAKEGKDDGSN
jgi:hypothetical protein